jgi:hypothetical protein
MSSLLALQRLNFIQIIFKISVHTSQKKTHSITNTNRLMLFQEIIAIYSENPTKSTNNLWAEC